MHFSGCALQDFISSSHFICMDNEFVTLVFYFVCHLFPTPTMCWTSMKKEEGEFLIRLFLRHFQKRKRTLCLNTYTIQIYAKAWKKEVSGVQTFLNTWLGCVSSPLPHILLTAAQIILHMPVGNSNHKLSSHPPLWINPLINIHQTYYIHRGVCVCSSLACCLELLSWWR